MHYLAFAVLVLGSVALGAMGATWIAVRRLERQQLVAHLDAAEAAPVPLVVDVTAKALALPPPPPEPLPPHLASMAALVAGCHGDPPAPPPEWVTTTATTGDLTFARVNMELDDFALYLEEGFHSLSEQVRTRFAAIRITG
jgi:hypothetical protein